MLCMLLTNEALTQTVSLSGTVKNDKGEILQFAAIIASSKANDNRLAYTLSDEEGQYHLPLKQLHRYTISVSYLGYQKYEFDITPNSDLSKDIILKEAIHQLNTVIIELPVTVKKDTITYNPQTFVDGTERKLKNLLKKLPGFDLDGKGGVTVLGKRVTRLLVDGKKFFDGNTKLGIENIPADAIKKIEVIDNYNEVSFLKNISDSDNMAMNIQLKEDKKHFAFGNLEAGTGHTGFYKSTASLYYYTPKTTVNVIGNSNNIGEKSLTFKDYLNFQGGINAVFNSDFNWTGGLLSQFLKNKNNLSNTQHFGAVNFTRAVTDKLELSGYAVLSYNKERSFQESSREYTAFSELRQVHGSTKTRFGVTKLNLSFTPTPQEQFYIRSQIKINTNDYSKDVLSAVNQQSNSIITQKNIKTSYANQSFEWHKNQSEKHRFSAILQTIVEENTATNHWNASQPFLARIKPILPPINPHQSQLAIRQTKKETQQLLQTTLKDFWLLSDHHHIYTTLGDTYQREKFIHRDAQLLDDASVNNFDPGGFNNHVVFTLNNFFSGLHYKFKAGIFTCKQGLFLHSYHWQINQSNSQIDHHKWVLLPDFLIKIEFNKSKKIQLNYKLKTRFPNVSKLTNRYYLESYNTVFRGNEHLENELYHSLTVYYSRFSLYRNVLLLLSANYQKKIRGFSTTVNFKSINRITSIALLNNAIEHWNLRGSIKKKIKKIQYQLRLNYTQAKFLQQLNSSLVVNTNKKFSYELSAKTSFHNFQNIAIGYKGNTGKYITDANSTTFVVHNPFASIAYSPCKNLRLKANYHHYHYQNQNLRQHTYYTIVNTSLSYQKKDSPWNFELRLQNLNNEKFKQSNRFSSYVISDTKNYILPRIFLLSIGYKL